MCVYIAEKSAEIEVDSASLVTRYAGMGYNILQANPEGDFNRGGIDPGIKTTRFVFKHTYTQGNEIYYQGRRMQVPDQVTFHQTHSCAQSHSTKAYSGQTSYRKELSVNVETEGKKNKISCSIKRTCIQPPTTADFFQQGLHLAVVSEYLKHMHALRLHVKKYNYVYYIGMVFCYFCERK